MTRRTPFIAALTSVILLPLYALSWLLALVAVTIGFVAGLVEVAWDDPDSL